MPASTTTGRLAEYFDRELVAPARQMLIGRKLFAKVTTVPKGKTAIELNTITDMGSATIQENGLSGEITRDLIKWTPTQIKIPLIYRGFEIPRDTFNAWASEGVQIESDVMLSAAYKVMQAEDDMLIQSWKPDGSTASISGLYASAGNTYGTSADFGTFGNPMIAVAAAKAKIAEDNIVDCNFNLILNPTQYHELSKSVSTGLREWPLVMELLNQVEGAPRGNIYQSVDITDGTGLLTPVDASGKYIDLVVESDMHNIVGMKSELGEESPVLGIVCERLVPRIKHANSIATLTAI